MERETIKVVVDTNWWVSLVINRFKSQLADLLLRPELQFCSSTELDEEIVSTLHSKSLQRYFDPAIRQAFLELYPTAVVQVDVQSEVTACRDPKDNFLLALAQDAQADYLITGDKDLLVLDPFGAIRILKMGDFLATLDLKQVF